ncbi:MAG: hypothetical protein GY940_11470 [bacterium]|nr:hypothetical protein [bacterium]
MALEANIVYLEEELNNNRERLELMETFLKENPSVSVYKRKISGRTYYYKKYWKNGKSVSDFLGKDGSDFGNTLNSIKVANEKRQQIKEQLKTTKKIISALEKQLKIAREAYQNVSV